MRVTIVAVGRLRTGPEKDLLDDYLTRFDRTGRAYGLGPANVVEVDDRKGGGMSGEAKLLETAIPENAFRIMLDERGKVISSPAFSNLMMDEAQNSRRDLALIIGGADGIDPSLRKTANFTLSFGKMVWPHMMVRVMVGEQLYRAASIQSGAPYHRV